MHGSRRDFLRNTLVGAGLASTGTAWASEAATPRMDPAPKAPYHVEHGWPAVPQGFFFGQISGVGVDSNNQVVVFNRADHSFGQSLSPISVPAILSYDGKTGKQTGAWGANTFVKPHGLRVDHEDNVWVTDIALQQVFKFTRRGKRLMTLGVKGVEGCDATHFNQPTDIAVEPDGSFYVSDGYGNSRVAKFSPSGKFLFDWGRKGDKPGEFNIPHNVTLDASGRVYVADRSNARIQVFDPNGKFLYLWKSNELGSPWALDIGPDNYLYMVDVTHANPLPPNSSHVKRLDLKGNILEKWSRFGKYDGEIYLGHCIAVGKDLAVYVGDVGYGMRVQKFTRSARKCNCLRS